MLLSKKHGLNPTIEMCWLCNKDKGLLLFGRMKGDVAAPRKTVFNTEPCDECKEWQKKGIILISIRDGEEGSDNPYRTGGWCVVKAAYLKRVLEPGALKGILKQRYAFVGDSTWERLGL